MAKETRAAPKKTPPAAEAPKDPALASLAGGDTGAGEAQDTQPDPAKPDPVVTHYHIAARTNGFRRCGRAWPAAGVEVAVADLAEGDIERLLAERELVVTPIAKAAE